MLKEDVNVYLKADLPGVYIGDPCYILRDEIYYGIWEDKYNFEDGTVYTDDNRLVMIVASTFNGDGIYPAFGHVYGANRVGNHESFSVPVDAGVVALVNLEFAKEDWKEDPICNGENGEGYVSEKPVSQVMFFADRDGHFEIEVHNTDKSKFDFEIHTEPEDGNEELYDEEEPYDEPYVDDEYDGDY
jgi:hypothetical protein